MTIHKRVVFPIHRHETIRRTWWFWIWLQIGLCTLYQKFCLRRVAYSEGNRRRENDERPFRKKTYSTERFSLSLRFYGKGTIQSNSGMSYTREEERSNVIANLTLRYKRRRCTLRIHPATWMMRDSVAYKWLKSIFTPHMIAKYITEAFCAPGSRVYTKFSDFALSHVCYSIDSLSVAILSPQA